MKTATFKQLGLIQWMVRMHKPELEKINGYKNLKKLNVPQASVLINCLKKDEWDQADFIIRTLHP